MLFDSNQNSEACLDTESNGQMVLFVAIVVLISIRTLFVEIAEAMLSVISLFFSLIPTKSET
jgi:hypothetical protein